jgi:ribosomal subunit interface protein
MKIDFVFKPKVTSGESIKEFINEKTGKLEKYFNGEFHARWTFDKENDDFTSHLHVVGNRIDYFGEDRSTNLLSAIESCVDKIERQLRKRKEIVKDHH